MNWPPLASPAKNPVSEAAHSPLSISVVIPSAGAPSVFDECLCALIRGDRQPDEIILVDDAMDTSAYAIAEKWGIRVVDNRGQGVSAARNAGARAASGDIILFTDTDVVFPPSALSRVTTFFMAHPKVAGCVGIQSAGLRFTNFASRYKNHWMRFTYHRLRNPVNLFYTSCAAIRREVFLRTPGFDEQYRLPSIEDTAFGDELAKQCADIFVIPDLEVEHAKSYTGWKVLITDFARSSALMRYVLRKSRDRRSGCIRSTSVPKRFMVACMLMGLSWLGLGAALLIPFPALGFSGFCLLGLLLLNATWLEYLNREESALFALQATAFLPIDLTVVIAGMVAGVTGYLFGRRY